MPTPDIKMVDSFMAEMLWEPGILSPSLPSVHSPFFFFPFSTQASHSSPVKIQIPAENSQSPVKAEEPVTKKPKLEEG